MSRDIVHTCPGTSFHLTIARAVGSRVRIEGKVPEQLPVLGQDPHVEAVDQGEHPRAGEVPAKPDVV